LLAVLPFFVGQGSAEGDGSKDVSHDLVVRQRRLPFAGQLLQPCECSLAAVCGCLIRIAVRKSAVHERDDRQYAKQHRFHVFLLVDRQERSFKRASCGRQCAASCQWGMTFVM
jgi:hypothetical protein